MVEKEEMERHFQLLVDIIMMAEVVVVVTEVPVEK
jgi:hypothetical protein